MIQLRWKVGNMPKEKVTKKKKETKETKEVNLDKIKKEIYAYTEETVRKYYLQEVEKANKIIIREKNKKILFRNFIITLLLLVIVFLLYLLNSVGYFARLANQDYQEDEVVNRVEPRTDEKNNNSDKETKKEPTLSELIETYGYLLKDFTIDEESSYIKDYYSGNLTNELKNYLALNIVDLKKLDDMDDYNMFSDAILKAAYEELFSDNYKSVTFNYNGNQIRYINKLNSYITTDIVKKTETNIKREIINIKVDGNKITIETIEGVVKDDKLYNIKDDKEISEYKKDSILNYKDKLNKVIYTFESNKLTSIK